VTAGFPRGELRERRAHRVGNYLNAATNPRLVWPAEPRNRRAWAHPPAISAGQMPHGQHQFLLVDFRPDFMKEGYLRG
jgi:hypothetical protein